MRRADRLFAIVQHLRGGRLITAQTLAERLEVSTRTIYRDIADLQAQGVPVDGEAGYGYVLADGYHLPPLMFSDDEIVALVAGARMLRAWGGADMARAAEEALVKIGAVLPDAARARVDRVPVYAMFPDIADETRAKIDRIEAAVDAQLRLVFDYTDKMDVPTTRMIRPLGLWFWGKTWTTVGWCELRMGFRMFRLDRMTITAEGPEFRMEKGKSLRDFYAQMEAEGVRLPTKGPR